MVVVEIQTPVYDEESGVIRWTGCAIVRAEGKDLDIYPYLKASVIDRDVPVVDMATGKQLRGDDNPEVWARNLPYAFRAGDLVATVVIDTDSPEHPARNVTDPTEPIVPDPPAFTRLRDASASTV